MSDKNVELTRRKVLGGLTFIGAAGAIGGAGTWAAFSDTEESTKNYVQAGTLDLTIDGANDPVVTLEVDKAAPGASGGPESSTLTNAGSLDGNLAVEVLDVRSSEGDNSSEAEGNTATGDGGELDQFLTVNIGFGGGAAVISNTANNLTGATGTGPSLASGGSSSLDMSYAVDSAATNDAQGDRVEIDVQVSLKQ